MEKLRNIWEKVTSTMLTCAGVVIFFSVVVQVVNTICRKWFGFAILWCDEVTQYAVIEACLFATPYLIMHNKELSVGVLSSIIKNEKILKAIRLLFLLVEIALFLMMARYCIVAAVSMKKANMMLNTLRIPKYYLYYLAEVSFVVDVLSMISAPLLNKGGFYHD